MNIEIVYAAKAAAEAYDVPVAWVAALIDKESNGIVLNDVDGEKRPTVRFEGHYFDARLIGDARDTARAAGLAAPKAGKIKNPKSQADRWCKLIAPAAAIDADAAYESVSWGVGQVMGAHWKKLGFASVGDLVKAAMSGLAGQVDLMMRYLKAFELLDELRRGDALGLARGYNGPANARAYAADLEKRAKTYGADSASLTAVAGMLRQGMRGAAVRDLQALLTRAGTYTARIDGDFGPTTKASVRTFQRRSGITDDGVAGPETMRALATYRTAPTEALATVGPLQTAEARQGGTAAATGLGALEVVKEVQPYVDQLNGYADKLQSFSSLSSLAGYATTALCIIGGLLIVGGLIWGAVGWVNSRRTVGGV